MESDSTPNLEFLARSVSETLASGRLTQAGPPEDTRGTELCLELEALKRGKGHWNRYEELCGRIIEYLFPNDLHGWHSHYKTDDGLNSFEYSMPDTANNRFLAIPD